MSDQELLELAAKAAGVELKFDTFGNSENADREYNYWNPLADDGDAFRLAVKLNMDLMQYVDGEDRNNPEPHACANYSFHEYYSENGGCGYAATRRAIVRAAAEIGREMP